jgi:hypothetical protein
MAQQSKTTLKTYFNTGDTPTEAQFVDLIDSYQDASAVLAATTASFTTADETKLDGIEAGADVTDATNVAAAGAVMNTGNSTIAGVKTFSSSPIVPAPTTDLQAATKKYVDDAVTAGGGYTNEMAQDAVGAMAASSARIALSYTDATPSLTADLILDSVEIDFLSPTVQASLALADSALQAANISATITNGVTNKAPSEDAVFDALEAKQDTLVSGTNIKTVNSTSLLGSGNIVISGGGTPAGVSGDIQFNDAGAFGGDSQFDWDNTNKRLLIGNSPAGVGSFSLRKTGLSGTGNDIFQLAFENAGYGTAYKILVSQSYGSAILTLTGATGSGMNFSATGTTGTIATQNLGTLVFQSSIFDFQTVLSGAGKGLTIKDNTGSVFFRADNNTKAIIINGSASAPVASAQFQVDSTTKGLLPPRMTTAQKNAIATPAAGLMVYDTDTNKLCCYNGTIWNDLF